MARSAPAATLATAQVLAALALGLPAQVLAKVLAPGFYAHEDTATPVRVAAVALGVNVAAAVLLTRPLGHVGLALALSLSSWANFAGLAWLLWRRGRLCPDSDPAPPRPRHLRAVAGHGRGAAGAGGLLSEPGPVALALVIGSAGAAPSLSPPGSPVPSTSPLWRRASRA